jgi:hypothetical protein
LKFYKIEFLTYGGNMKKLLLLVSLIFIIFSGCSSDDNGSDNPLGNLGGITGGGGGGGTGNVTFTIQVVQDQQNGLYFAFTPSTGVTITKIVAVCQAAGVNETLNDADIEDGIYNTTQPLYVGPLTGLQSGQQWNFTISGNIGSAQGQTYSSPVNYTIP